MHAEQPLVSVVIPTYNRSKLVRAAIDSVLAQTVRVDEVIVVDDGSTDDTARVLQQEYGDRVRYIHQANSGVSRARNRGLAVARGRYLTLLDSDDEWLPEKTELQLDWLERRPEYGMVLCDLLAFDVARGREYPIRRRAQLPEDGRILKWVLVSPFLPPSALMMRRAVYEDVGGFDVDLPTAEDLQYHIRIARRWPIGLIEMPLTKVIRGDDGLSSLPRSMLDDLAVIDQAIATCRGSVEDVWLRRARSRAYSRNARGMIYANDWRAALRLASVALREGPDLTARREAIEVPILLALRGLRSIGRRALRRR
ncbi:MAG TPA: glycosyltransferase family 2 protein [Burkholderiaceae bacterium]|nr:glycosyltransferase family 2 protein [Burkholderiaceae bacterium]